MEISPEGVWTLHTSEVRLRDLDESPYKQAEELACISLG